MQAVHFILFLLWRATTAHATAEKEIQGRIGRP
jgi:hypothetical protein